MSITAGHGLFEAFEHERRPNTDAIAQMALENYQEMREAVLDPEYRRKKKEAEELEKKDPNFIPRYSMVMFHPEIAVSRALGARQFALTTQAAASRVAMPGHQARLVSDGPSQECPHFPGSRVAVGHRGVFSRLVLDRSNSMGNEAPVLIAGGGLTGLAMASFLAQQGIRSITVERLKESSPLPRAAFFHMRTIEMFRELGIEARVREESAKEFVPDGALIAMDCVSGRKLADIISNLNEGVDAVSPCRRWFLNQPSLEPILREKARAAGAEILQGTEITGAAPGRLRRDRHGARRGRRQPA